ncbi:MAG: penicillin-binding protein transpeptidase [Actinomycetia bacterium]|nr:penicillin-binding protein transpeptidase [Actinomycetes bacterium]
MAAEQAEPDGSNPVWLVVGAAVAVLAVLVGVLVLTDHDDEPKGPIRDVRAEATDTAERWLGAWAADDRTELHRLLAAPAPALDPALDQFDDGLDPVRITATAGAPVVTGAQATVPFDATVVLPGLGPWTYRGSLALADTEVPVGKDPKGDTELQWRVAFTPAAIHPDLAAGRSLRRSRTFSPRGVLQATDGSPLPTSGPLRSIVGSVGAASAAQVATLGPAYEAGDAVGQSGLQAGFQQQLAGRPSGEVRLLEGTRVVKVEATFDGTPGQSVRTTFDPRFLAAAQAALGEAGNPAALVVIQPSTGAIRAIANRPSNGFNRALAGRYPPGSTAKVITTLALLQHGVTEATRISCPKEVTVNGRTISNAEDEELGDISFADAFAHSCNTAFIQLAQRLEAQQLLDAARSLGFDADPDLGTGAATSQFPPPSGIVDQVSEAIGQGRVLATPLQMASVAATIGAGGYRKPHLVETPVPVPFLPLPAGVAPVMQDLMRQVVTRGTGQKARLPGTPVAGKTGTAEFGTAVPLHTHAWFIAFRGDVAVAVIVEDGGFGGDAAAPIAANFLARVGG